MIPILTALYLACFQLAAVPAVVRVWRLKSSRDLSVWREWIVLTGVVLQAIVMVQTGASVYVLVSPLFSALSLTVVLATIYRHR